HAAQPGWARRPTQAQAVGAVRRSAAARRDRACARVEADDPLRRRADRKPRLQDRRRDPRPRALVDRCVRADNGDGDARGARSGDCRPRPLHRRRPDRARAPRREPGGRAGRHERTAVVLAVALKGLAGRKLRAALTAIAIILGVAMISGTYVLTDTINSAF